MRIRGYACCGTPMVVTSTRRPSRYLIVRYRRCLRCGGRVITEERVSATRKPARPNDGTPNDKPAN